MSEHYDFHYQPTGSGAISGQQVLEQTEDAINELGDYVNDNVGGAMDVAQQALETAQNAEQDAQTALDTANSFSSAIQSAQQDASTALSTAQTAQTTASNANNTAIQAQQDASSAVTTANNASGQVSTLSGTVTALGQRVTTAEGNIGQNTSDISALTTRVGTAEGNITTLQNDVSVAMGNASSAMATAGTVKQQAYVLRYSSSSVTDNSTIAYSTLDNTDNIKASDKVIDVDGKIFSVVSVDTANQTVTVGTALVDLALDANVVHTSGEESITGTKRFGVVQNFTGYPSIRLYSLTDDINVLPSAHEQRDIRFTDKNNVPIAYFLFQHRNDASEPFRTCWRQPRLDGTSNYYSVNFNNLGEFYPENDTGIKLGTSTKRWSEVYATNYYYGSNNVEFSTKFVTTDTAQTITERKTFTKNVTIKNEDVTIGSTSGAGSKDLTFTDSADNALAKITGNKASNGSSGINFRVDTTDNNNASINSQFSFFIAKSGAKVVNPIPDNDISLGRTSNRWKDTCTYLINGLEPSSLSLPSDNINDIIDISSYLSVLNGSNANTYVAPANGWISITMSNCSGIQAYITGLWGHQIVRPTVGGVRFFMPVLKNKTANILIFSGTIDNARFIPCQGNV